MGESIQIEERGDGYVLLKTDEAGRTSEMTLSSESALSLLRSVQRMTDRVLARLHAGASNAVIVSEIARVEFEVDAQEAQILMTMIDPDEAAQMFCLFEHTARDLLRDLAREVENLARVNKGRPVQ
jgi:hypothetical protein